LYFDLFHLKLKYIIINFKGLIKTFTHDTCLAEEDLTDPLLYVKNEYSAKVKITRTDG
jgi:hypothetical protein